MGNGHSIKARINGIRFWIDNPCDAPWFIYAETAFLPAVKVSLQLVLFSMQDLIRAYFRPKGLRSGRHLRRGSKGGRKKGVRRKRWSIPDTPELIAKRLPGYEATAQRQVSQGVKALWRVDGVLQRYALYFLIADLASDFFFEWSSAIMETEYCKQAKAGAGALEFNDFLAVATAWTTPGNRHLLYANYPVYWPGADSLVVQASKFSAYFGCTLEPFNYPPSSGYGYRTRIEISGGATYGESDLQNDLNANGVGAISGVHLSGPSSVIPEVRSYGGFLEHGEGFLFVKATGDPVV